MVDDEIPNVGLAAAASSSLSLTTLDPSLGSNNIKSENENMETSPPSTSVSLLEGTFLYRRETRSVKAFLIKSSTRVHASFDASGLARRLVCHSIGPAATYTAATADDERSVCLDFTLRLPWTVRDVENDPAAFMIEVSTAGYEYHAEGGGGDADNDEGDEHADDGEEDNNDDDDDDEDFDDDDEDGVYAIWGDSDDDEETVGNGDDQSCKFKSSRSTTTTDAQPLDQLAFDLAHAAGKNKPHVRYIFRCPSKLHDKAPWLAAFAKAGRLSGESMKKRTFGTATVVTARLSMPTPGAAKRSGNSRIRRVLATAEELPPPAKASSTRNAYAVVKWDDAIVVAMPLTVLILSLGWHFSRWGSEAAGGQVF